MVGVPMEKGIHIPTKDMFKTLDLNQQNLEETYRDISIASAVVVPDTNDFGTKGKRTDLNFAAFFLFSNWRYKKRAKFQT